MGLFSWLFAKPSPPQELRSAVIPPTGAFSLPIVGEASYQEALLFICGGKTTESANRICDAVLIFENTNPHDSNAIRVDIQGMTVGYLSREHAKQFRRQWKQEGLPEVPATCRAIIKGGWYRGPQDEGHFGVCLDIPVQA